MTAAAAEPGGTYRLTMWLAHREPHAMAAALVCNLASAAATRLAPDLAGVPRAALTAAALLTVVWMMAAALAAGRHRRTLCLRCARKTPLDGAATAARHDRALLAFHWCHSRRGSQVIIALMVPLVVAALAGADSLVRQAVALPLFLFFGVSAAAGLRHRPLEPWCRYCRRWDDGGDPETAPTPPPVREGTR